MLEFKKPLKIYLFKDRGEPERGGRVSFNIRVSENTVNSWDFDADEFEQVLEQWDKDYGYDCKLRNGTHVSIEHKKRTPRPESASASYVRISIFPGNRLSFHYRCSYDDMREVAHEYWYQKHNTMYWDPK